MSSGDCILVLTDESDAHTDVFIQTAKSMAPEVELFRFHPDKFPEGATLTVSLRENTLSGELRFYNRTLDLSRVRSVWMRRPRRPSMHPQMDELYRTWAQLECEQALYGLWDALDVFIVNPPLANRKAARKLNQLRVASQLGFLISPTLISNAAEAAQAFFGEHVTDGVIIKPLSRPNITDTKRVDEIRFMYTEKINPSMMQGEQLERIRHTPVQLQRLVKKECEVRVTVIGEHIFAAELRTTVHHVDIRRWKETTPSYAVHELPKETAERCLAIVRHFGLAYGAIDLLLTPNGEYIFLEINPSGQFYWIEQETGQPMMAAMVDLLVRAPQKAQVSTETWTSTSSPT